MIFPPFTFMDVFLHAKKIAGRDSRAEDWVGKAVADALGLDMDEPAVRKRILAMLKIWLGSGALKVVKGVSKDRHAKKFVKVGEWAV